MYGIDNEKGYALLESLIALLLLSIVSVTLVGVLPFLIDSRARMDSEQAVYHLLHEMHIREGVGGVFEEGVFRDGDEICKIHIWRDGTSREICL